MLRHSRSAPFKNGDKFDGYILHAKCISNRHYEAILLLPVEAARFSHCNSIWKGPVNNWRFVPIVVLNSFVNQVADSKSPSQCERRPKFAKEPNGFANFDGYRRLEPRSDVRRELRAHAVDENIVLSSGRFETIRHSDCLATFHKCYLQTLRWEMHERPFMWVSAYAVFLEIAKVGECVKQHFSSFNEGTSISF
jgi:hypothetical protein